MQDFNLTVLQDMPFLKSGILLGISVFVTFVSPGPSIALVIKNSIAHSRRAGIACAAGITLSVMFFMVIALLGLGVVLKKSEILYRLVQGVGGMFLLYVGVMSFKNAGTTDYTQQQDGAVARSSFTEGFFVTMLNPQAILAFMAISATYIMPCTPFYVQTLYTIEILLLCFAWFGSTAVILSLPQLKQHFISKLDVIERITAASLFVMGGFILYKAVS